MRKYLLIGAALLAVATTMPARAADLPVKAIPVPVPVWSWTGFYIGLNAGYSWGRARTDLTFGSTAGAVFGTGSASNNMNGFIGGGQLGYNWQSNNWVLGLEGDIQWSAQKGNFAALCPTGVCTPGAIILVAPGPAVNVAGESKLNWLATLRARGGVLFSPTILAYVTGGFAFGDVETNFTMSTPAISNAFSSSATKTGWTLGVGVEGRITGNWTAKLEYLYVDLGRFSGTAVSTIPAAGGGFVTANFNTKVSDNILRVGLNYNFR